MPVDVGKFLADRKIKLRSQKFGTQYTTCPMCSHKRKGANKTLRCLSVTIDADGIVVNCHHCQWSDYDNAKREAREGDRGQRAVPRKGGGYGSLQRSPLSRWVNRS